MYLKYVLFLLFCYLLIHKNNFFQHVKQLLKHIDKKTVLCF